MPDVTRRRALLVIGLATAGCSDGPTAPSTIRTSAVPVGVKIAGPGAVAPGATAQYRATLLYADGRTEESSAGLIWSSSKPKVLLINPDGSARGIDRGVSELLLKVGSLIHTTTVRVLEPDTFILTGTVAEAAQSQAIAGATVVVESGTGAGLTGTTDDRGACELYGVAGAVRLSCQAAGYQSQSVTTTVTRDSAMHVFLNAVVTAPPGESGFLIEGPTRLAPNERAKYRALLQFTDGSTQDVTKQAHLYTMSPPGIYPLSINADGSALALDEGHVGVHAEYGAFRHGLGVIVTPPGTFVVSGGVSDSVTGQRVAPDMSVVSGQAKVVVLYDFWGFLLTSAVGPIRLLASHPSYVTRTIDLTVNADMTFGFTMTPSE